MFLNGVDFLYALLVGAVLPFAHYPALVLGGVVAYVGTRVLLERYGLEILARLRRFLGRELPEDATEDEWSVTIQGAILILTSFLALAFPVLSIIV